MPVPHLAEVVARGMTLDLHIEHCREPDQVRAAAAYIGPVIEAAVQAA
jgi:hypothetical protein